MDNKLKKLSQTKEMKEDLRANTLRLRQAFNLRAKGMYLESRYAKPEGEQPVQIEEQVQ